MSRALLEAAAGKSRPCKLCGRQLVLVRDSTGKLQALDAAAPVFTIRADANGDPVAVLATTSAVDHHATCAQSRRLAAG